MIESIGFWNKINVSKLSEKTGVSVETLWNIIEEQSNIEFEDKLRQYSLMKEHREHKEKIRIFENGKIRTVS